MLKKMYFCDHCGHELDEMHDYTEILIDNFIDNFEADLCLECYEELNEIVLKFLNKKQGK